MEESGNAPGRFVAQARVLIAKLEEPGQGSLSLGDEAAELVAWMVEQGLVEVEAREVSTWVVRLPRSTQNRGGRNNEVVSR